MRGQNSHGGQRRLDDNVYDGENSLSMAWLQWVSPAWVRETRTWPTAALGWGKMDLHHPSLSIFGRFEASVWTSQLVKRLSEWVKGQGGERGAEKKFQK